MGKEKVGTVRKRLQLADIEVLMKLRGLTENKFATLDGTNPPVYRPRTTKDEWREILNARAERETEAKKDQMPADASTYIKKLFTNRSLTVSSKVSLISANFDVPHETAKKWIGDLFDNLDDSEYAIAKQKVIPKSKIYLISSAQNACACNMALLENMKQYAQYIGAEIAIIATRYLNPTSVWFKSHDTWDSAVHPYLTAKRHTLHKHLELLADLKVQATAPSPTAGIELFGAGRSCIVGSPRIEMRSLPVLEENAQKFLYSTGTVTAPSFTDSVAGGKAQEHHSYGFCVVEIESDDVVHVRNVSAQRCGSFNDLMYRVENGKISFENVDIMVWGDSHFAQKEQRVTDACRQMCADMGIKTSILHDIFDSASINVHNVNNPIQRHELERQKRDNLEDELSNTMSELNWFEKNMKKTYVIASNHDSMLDRAMMAYDWKDNLKNARTFVELLSVSLSGNAPKGLIPYLINSTFTRVEGLGDQDSLILHGVELALHGHKGPNGSKGNINAFSRLSTKTIIGHSHSPAIKWGCYQVGISCKMNHGYNHGLSSWSYANCLLNKHGKRQMIVLNKDTLTYTTLYQNGI